MISSQRVSLLVLINKLIILLLFYFKSKQKVKKDVPMVLEETYHEGCTYRTRWRTQWPWTETYHEGCAGPSKGPNGPGPRPTMKGVQDQVKDPMALRYVEDLSTLSSFSRMLSTFSWKHVSHAYSFSTYQQTQLQKHIEHQKL